MDFIISVTARNYHDARKKQEKTAKKKIIFIFACIGAVFCYLSRMATHEIKSLLIQAARTPRWLADKSGYSIGTIYGVLSVKADHPSKNDKTFAKLRAILKEEIERDCDPLAVDESASITIAAEITAKQAVEAINEAAL